MENIIIKIDGHEVPVSFEGSDKIIVDGKEVDVEMFKRIGDNVFSFAVNHKLCTVEYAYKGAGECSLTLDGMSFAISMKDETQKLLGQFIAASGVGSSNGASKIKAPMPGIIVKIAVSEGQEVQPGDELIIIEAMKMENSLKAEIGGTVKKILVNESEAVEKNKLMIELEPEE
jgi:biotin carboxyl carrier protein